MQHNQQSKTEILASCTRHIQGHVHYHALLSITYLGEPFTIPANTGIENGCMHPLHTHDTTGRIHIDYHTPYPFTLGDFFTSWGIVFHSRQVGSILAGNRYIITMLVNGKNNTQFEKYVIHDQDTIHIKITKKKNY